MIFGWLQSTLVTAVLALPTLAWAGGTSGTGGTSGGPSDTGVGGSSGDTGTSTGTTSGGSSSDGSSSGQECFECTDSTDVVTIVSPADGDVVGTTFEVRVTAPYTCYCDTCGCYAEDPFTTTLRVDGSSYVNCNGDDCDTSDVTFTVMLPPGTYELDAAADHDLSVEFSAKVTVTVEGEVATGDTTGSGEAGVTVGMTGNSTSGNSGSGSTGEAPASDDGGGGCGCRTQPAAPWGALWSVVVLGALRRRRR